MALMAVDFNTISFRGHFINRVCTLALGTIQPALLQRHSSPEIGLTKK